MPSLKILTNGLTLVAIDTRPKRSVLAFIQDHLNSSICLSEGCGRKAHSRGLCSKCWQRFRAALSDFAPDERAAEEARWIRDGRILRPREKQRSRNPFRQVAVG